MAASGSVGNCIVQYNKFISSYQPCNTENTNVLRTIFVLVFRVLHLLKLIFFITEWFNWILLFRQKYKIMYRNIGYCTNNAMQIKLHWPQHLLVRGRAIWREIFLWIMQASKAVLYFNYTRKTILMYVVSNRLFSSYFGFRRVWWAKQKLK